MKILLIVVIILAACPVGGWLESCNPQTPPPAPITVAPTLTTTPTLVPPTATVEPTLTSTPTLMPTITQAVTITLTPTEVPTDTPTPTQTPINTTVPGRPGTIPTTGGNPPDLTLLILFGALLLLGSAGLFARANRG